MSEAISAPNRRVLLVDDHPAIHADYRKVFQLSAASESAMDAASAVFFGDAVAPGSDAEFELQSASQGEEALAMVRTAKALGQPYAIAFIDMRMPPGWDGLETTLRLWEVCPDLQVVICTAYSDYSWEEMSARIGRTDRLVLLKKPFDPLEVLQLAHALTEKWRLVQQARARTAELENRVRERTHELEAANEKLEAEMAERIRTEEALRQAQKMEAVGELAGGLAHDFNNLLSVIHGYTGLLAHEEGLRQSARDALREVDNAAERATTLIRQLLSFSRKQVMTPDYFELREALGAAGKLLRRVIREDIALEIDLGEGGAEIRADAVMIEQVILNLAVNARDAMPCGGRLCIRSSVEELSVEEARRRPGARAGRFAVLTIRDNGSGIAPENLQRIFEPFFTTKEVGKGSGLGLAAVHGIVQQHEGWIEVASIPGEGTTFRMHLPVAPRPAGSAPRSTMVPTIAGGTETILLVEDEASLCTAARLALQYYGYRVLSAASGADALKLWPAHAGEIDLLLTDMVMPDGVSGPELAQRLRRERGDLKVLYSSGYSRELATRETLLADGFHFLPKPYTPVKLATAVRDCLDGKRRGAPIAA